VSNLIFPLYRRYSGVTIWFEILSESAFRELRVMPMAYSFSLFEAAILPDRNYIHDLIHCSQPGIISVDPHEFFEALEHAKSALNEVTV
jgi:hypothetical protein